MKGIHFVTDERNRKVAVQIDLRRYREIWEDFYDVLVAERRKDDEKLSWEEAKAILEKAGK